MSDQIKITGTARIPGWRTYDVDLDLELSPRDLFAAFALAGILAQPNGNPLGNPHDVGLRWCAATAYGLADAMLDQRKQESKP